MSTPSEKANLARIRDNQRRSRARRKEYLQELEQRLRLCELQGIEASAEIQVAARKVAEENKKLRLLLNKQGVYDQSIEHYLVSGVVPQSTGQDVSSHFQPTMSGGNVDTLEQLLEPRRPNIGEAKSPFCPVPSNVGVGAGTIKMLDVMAAQASREASVASMWDTVSGSNSPLTRSFPTLASHGRIQPAQQYLTPNSTPNGSSRTEVGLAVQGLGSMMDDPRTSSANVSPVSVAGDASVQSGYGYDMNMIPSPTAFTTPQHRRQKLILQTPTNCVPSPISPTYMPSASSTDSCSMTTDYMSAMGGADPEHVRAALSCLPQMDCQVDNVNFATAMERYTAAIGMQ